MLILDGQSAWLYPSVFPTILTDFEDDYPALVWKRPLLSFWCVFLWSTFKSVFIAQGISVDGRPKRIKMYACSNENALVLIRPKSAAWTSLIVFAQGTKKIIFTACHSGKLKLALTSPDVISTSPKSFLMSRIDFTVLLLFKFLKKHHLPVGQVKNRIH